MIATEHADTPGKDSLVHGDRLVGAARSLQGVSEVVTVCQPTRIVTSQDALRVIDYRFVE